MDRKQLLDLMLSTDELATDVGSVVYGEQGGHMGLIDRLGGLSDALACLPSDDPAAEEQAAMKEMP